MIVDMWLWACALDIALLQHIHNHVKKHAKMAMNISDEIDLDKELKVFSVGGLKKKYNVRGVFATNGKCSESASKL